LTSLSELLNFVVQTLSSSETCEPETLQVLETVEFSEDQFALKVRVQLRNHNLLQVYLYMNRGHTDYAYQVLDAEIPILRWDNKEHFPSISTHPHHFHESDGHVRESKLVGNVERDLLLVLEFLGARRTEN
jgi:hypothetical protein